ncbi:MAG: CdaR family protein [Armatimonadota bacterium]
MFLQSLRKNINLKLLSLFFAVLLWIYVCFYQNPLSEVLARVDVVDVKIKNVPANLIVLDMPKKVTLKVKGVPKIISSIKPDKFDVYMDLADKKLGSNWVYIKVNSPSGVDVVDVNPKRVKIMLDEKEKRFFPVESKPVGSLPPSYSLEKILIDKDTAVIEGPSTILDRIRNVYAQPTLTDEKTDFVQKVELAAYDSREKPLSQLTINPKYVFVTVKVEQNFTTKTVPVEARISGSVENGYEITSIKLNPLSVMVQCPQDVEVDKIYTERIYVGGIDKNLRKEVKLEVPPRVILKTEDEVYIKITVEKK